MLTITEENASKYVTVKKKIPATPICVLLPVPEYKFNGIYPEKEVVPENVLTHEIIAGQFCECISKLGHNIPDKLVMVNKMALKFFVGEDGLYIFKNTNIFEFKDNLIRGLVAFNKITMKDEKEEWFKIFEYHFNKNKYNWIK